MYHHYRSRKPFAAMLARLQDKALKKIFKGDVKPSMAVEAEKNSGTGTPKTTPPLQTKRSGPRTATPEDKRSGYFSKNGQKMDRYYGTIQEMTENLERSLCGGCKKAELLLLAISFAVPDRAFFLSFLIMADALGLSGESLVGFYVETRLTCDGNAISETFIGVYERWTERFKNCPAEKAKAVLCAYELRARYR